jgi:hypothetical protein
MAIVLTVSQLLEMLSQRPPNGIVRREGCVIRVNPDDSNPSIVVFQDRPRGKKT